MMIDFPNVLEMVRRCNKRISIRLIEACLLTESIAELTHGDMFI